MEQQVSLNLISTALSIAAAFFTGNSVTIPVKEFGVTVGSNHVNVSLVQNGIVIQKVQP